MNTIEKIESIFKKNGIEWEIKQYNNYIDPNNKTASSIYSKLNRLYSDCDNKSEFTILNSGINDLLRMTVIVEYKEIVGIIKKLKETFSDLTGYIKIKSSGYRGIHLNLKIDGIPCEIQLAPQVVVMGVDYLHTLHEKWRDFDKNKEIKELQQKEQEIFKIKNNIRKNELMKQFLQDKKILDKKIDEEQKDFYLRENTYNDIYEVTEFSLYQKEIAEAIKELNISACNSTVLKDTQLIEIFNKNLVIQNRLDKDLIQQISNQLSQTLEGY